MLGRLTKSGDGLLYSVRHLHLHYDDVRGEEEEKLFTSELVMVTA